MTTSATPTGAGLNDDCDTSVVQTGNFADGTSNDAAIIHSSPQCGDAAAGAQFTAQRSTVRPDRHEDYAIVTGLTDTPISAER